ncbi:hypothetical protein VP01_15016g1, partial [Puccinia sorghi]
PQRIPKFFAYMDRYLSGKGRTYCAGNKLSVANLDLRGTHHFQDGHASGLIHRHNQQVNSHHKALPGN